MPFKPCPGMDALRTMPFIEEPCTKGLSDDEDAMSTSAGSCDLGLTESHASSFAEAEEPPVEPEVQETMVEPEVMEQNDSPQQIPRALFLLHRRCVSTSAAPEYSLRTVDAAQFGPVEPEILVPPGVFVPPGLEDNFDPSKYRQFAVVAKTQEELRSLLQKVSLELTTVQDRVSASSIPSHSKNEAPLQDWVFEDALGSLSTKKYERPDVQDDYLANLTASPVGKPIKTPQEQLQVSFEPCSMSKIGGVPEDPATMVVKLHLPMDAATGGAASEVMAWPECYNGLCDNWLGQSAVMEQVMPQTSLEWLTPSWGAFHKEWHPSGTSGF